MKAAPRCKRHGIVFIVALLALSTAPARDAAAQVASRLPVDGDSTAAPCRDGQLSVKHVSDDAAMGGARSTVYAFTNTSSSPCTLEGYPRFEVLGGAGRVVRGGRAKEGLTVLGDEAKAPPRRVTVEPGKAARFLVYYNAGGAGRMRPCPSYRRVRITAPGTRRGFVLRESLQLCGDLQVSPVGSPAAAEGR